MTPSLWKSEVTLAQLNQMNPNTIHQALGIEFTQMGADYLEAQMPVDERTKQPFGLLHGGASVVLAESLGSVASVLVVGSKDQVCMGLEINASHLRSTQEGMVYGRATAIRIGKSTHVWQIQIREKEDLSSRLICTCRLTVMITERSTASGTQQF